MNMRTPFSRVTGLGSAKEGTTHFWRQRLTALANVPLMAFWIWVVVTLIGADRATIVASFANPFLAALMVATIVSVTWHMRLGMQVVIEDYVHGEGMKMVLLIGNIFFALGVAALGVVFTLKLSFGG